MASRSYIDFYRCSFWMCYVALKQFLEYFNAFVELARSFGVLNAGFLIIGWQRLELTCFGLVYCEVVLFVFIFFEFFNDTVIHILTFEDFTRLF